MKILLLTLSEEEIKRGVCIPSGPVEVSPGERVTSPMRRIPKPYNWKLTNSRESYAMHNESEPPPALTIPLMVERMPVTDKGQGPHPASLFSYEEENHHKRKHKSPPHRGLGNDAMSKVLNQISKSPFMHKIEDAKLPQQFNQHAFTIYNGRTNPVEYVSHFNQRMTIHSKDEALMCKVFPSSLGPVAIRWFDGLKASSIDSFWGFTQAFGSCFITCSRVPQPLDSLLSLSMRDGEILKTYSNRY